MCSDDDDTATFGVEDAVKIGAPAVPKLVEALLSDTSGYSERNYYLCKALGMIGGDEAVRGVLQHMLQSSKPNHYLLNFFTDPDVEAIKKALTAGDVEGARARARARIDGAG